MSERHYSDGRSIDGFIYGEKIRSHDQVEESDLLIGDSHRFQATNLYRVVRIEKDKLVVKYVAPDGSDNVRDGHREMLVWSSSLHKKTDTYYRAIPKKP